MLRSVLFLFLGVFAAIQVSFAPPNPYPEEVKGMAFYARYLAPLRPHQSDTKQVIEVLGSAQRLEVGNWTISVLYSCNEDFVTCSHGPRNDRLDTIVVTPKRRQSMKQVKFSAGFTRTYGSVSEINVACDIYSDRFGLQYWIVSKDSASYKAGDLLWIHYGVVQQTAA